MNTILVLTDFSDTAFHAARYACFLSRQLDSKRIVLLYAFQTIISSEIAPNPDEIQILYDSSTTDLKNLKEKLSGSIPPDVVIDFKVVNDNLAAINKYIEEENADLVVMGMSGETKLERVLSIGSNAISVVDSSQKPVLVIPPQAEIKPIVHAVLACDLQKVSDTLPIEKLKEILDELMVSLSVVNIDHNNKNFKPETPLDISFLHESLKEYDPVYNYIDNPNIEEGIIEFATADKATIIIMVPKNYNFFKQLFHHSATHTIVYDAPIPILVLR